MPDFASSEKVNASWKHLFGLLGTSNGDGSSGKYWYEEQFPATHIVIPEDIWSDIVVLAATKIDAQAAAGPVIEDRSSGETVSIVSNGSDWNVSPTTIVPKIGLQLSDVHPNATYVKSITAVIDLGGGNYTITLNDNSGVSAGSAVLHTRVYLTEDITTNGLAWFAKEKVGNQFSNTIENFIQPQRFGQGYTVRLFEADGSEIYTTQGAWIFNWQKGLLLFANGFTADDESYNKPLYIEAFRYIGVLGAGDSLPTGVLNDTLRYNGSDWVTNSTLKADGTDVGVENRLTVSGSLVTASGTTPTTSADAGTEGEIRYAKNHIYIRSHGHWRRTSITKF